MNRGHLANSVTVFYDCWYIQLFNRKSVFVVVYLQIVSIRVILLFAWVNQFKAKTKKRSDAKTNEKHGTQNMKVFSQLPILYDFVWCKFHLRA